MSPKWRDSVSSRTRAAFDLGRTDAKDDDAPSAEEDDDDTDREDDMQDDMTVSGETEFERMLFIHDFVHAFFAASLSST